MLIFLPKFRVFFTGFNSVQSRDGRSGGAGMSNVFFAAFETLTGKAWIGGNGSGAKSRESPAQSYFSGMQARAGCDSNAGK